MSRPTQPLNAAGGSDVVKKLGARSPDPWIGRNWDELGPPWEGFWSACRAKSGRAVLSMGGESGLGEQWSLWELKGSQISSPTPSFCPRCFPTPGRRKPDIPVPYLYFDMGAAVLCASFMSFGVKRRWFALGAALQLAISTYAAYIGGYVHYGEWLKVSASTPKGASLWVRGNQRPMPRAVGGR